MALSDRIAVMSNGRVTALLEREPRPREADAGRRLRARSRNEQPGERRRPTDGIDGMTAAQPTLGRSGGGGSVALSLMKLRTFIALFAVLSFFSFAAPNFLSTANLILMSKHVALNAFLAMGMTFVIVTGGIDLSVGSIVGLCAMVAGGLILNGLDLRIGYTVYFNVVEVIADHARRRARDRRRSTALLITRLNVAPVHRDAGHALCRPRPGAAVVGRRDVSQSGRQGGPRHDRATAFSAPAACSDLPVVDLDC